MPRKGAIQNLRSKEKGARNEMPLKNKLFVDAYIRNGGNATRAYLEVYKGVSYETAGANGCTLLKDKRIKDEIEMRLHEIATPEWIEREIQKDIINGDKSQRTAALALLARIRSMVSEKRVNVVEQRKEYGEIVLDSFAEGVNKSDKVNVA